MKLTRCPHCETLFEVSLNELKTAEGAVRCGQCLRIFNATYHINGQETSLASDSSDCEVDRSNTTSDQTEDAEGNAISVAMASPTLENIAAEPLSNEPLSSRTWHASPSPHSQSIPTITERLDTHSLAESDHSAMSMEATAPVAERINAQSSLTRDATTMNSASVKTPLQTTASPSTSEETLDFEKLLGLKPAPASNPATSSTQADDLQALLQLAPEQTISTSEPAPSAAITDNHDEEPIDDDYDALAESWSDWVRQQWQWIGAAIILMLAGAIGVLSMTPTPSSGLSNYRIESTQVQTAPIQSRLNIRFELRNLTDQPMSLKGIEIKLKNLTDSILSEHHLGRSQLQGDLDPIPPFSTRTLEVEVPRPGTLVASVEITPLEND